MSTVWSRFRRRRGQQPLDGASSSQVDRLLDSARAPATPPELAREDEAAMLFHRAHLERAGASRTGDLKPTPAARTGLKAAVVSAGAVLLLSSGVAFAATGHTPWQAPDTPAGGRTSATSEAPSDASTAGSERTEGSEGTAGSASTAGSDPAAQAFRGLCRAYESGNKAVRGRALQSPAFDALVIAAGGPHRVATFCAEVSALPPTHPTHPSHPTHPTGGPTADASQPSASSDPTHPPHPSHPSHPTQSSHPTHPAHPTQGADPTPGAEATHPPHPTHPAHPTHS